MFPVIIFRSFCNIKLKFLHSVGSFFFQTKIANIYIFLVINKALQYC